MNSFFLNKKKGDNLYPYIIAEIGVNHEGSMKNAKKMIQQAAKYGANAAKFQTYKAESLASVNSPAYWNTKKEKITTQYKLFKKYDSFRKKDYEELAKYCKKNKIDFLSTPFDLKSVDFLSPLLTFFKVASADINNIPLLKKIARKKKPVVVSTGGSTIDEIEFAIDYLTNNGCPNVCLLHCVLNYPTKTKDANLEKITLLKNKFKKNIVGYSDHTFPDDSMLTLTTAYLKGARIIEKHFTYDKNLPGNDHYHSMDYKDLNNFVMNLKAIIKLLGDPNYSPKKLEKKARKNARRSIVTTKKLKKGSILSEKNITVKRPGTGISPMYWQKLMGKKIRNNLIKDHILLHKDILNKK